MDCIRLGGHHFWLILLCTPRPPLSHKCFDVLRSGCSRSFQLPRRNFLIR